MARPIQPTPNTENPTNRSTARHGIGLDTMAANNNAPITETITQSNIDEIVETLYDDDDGSLLGYACRQILEKNTVEPMDLVFYMDVRTPLDNTTESSLELSSGATGHQELALIQAQEVILREMSQDYGIDPVVSRGVRCFDLPVDGSTWLVEIIVRKSDFREVTLFGGCRELEWDPAAQDCNFYEARMKGSYIGAVATDEDGVPFGDVVEILDNLINGPSLVADLNNASSFSNAYETAFLGVPRVPDNPNFQGAGDEGRDILNDPVNVNTAIDANQAKANRKTITVVGGLLIACFWIAFALVGYVLFKRRRAYNRDNLAREVDLAVQESHNNNNLPGYAMEKGGETNDEDDEDDNNDDDDTDDYGREDLEEDDDLHDDEPRHQHQQSLHAEEYPDLPMSAEAIQMDLGNALKGQLMGLHGPDTPSGRQPRKTGGFYSSPYVNTEESESDDVDSWAQTDGTIGSLELQLEPITAEV